MNRIAVFCFCFMASVCLSPLTSQNLQAGALDSFLQELKTTTEEVIEETKAGLQVDDPAANQPKKISSKTALKAHDYESALTIEDKLCQRVVEPFELTGNFSSLFNNSLSTSLTSLITTSKVDKKKLLKSAKLEAKKMNWLPMSQEVYFGRQSHKDRFANDPQLIPRSKKGRVKRLYAQADKLLENVLAQIKEEHPYHFTIFLINSAEVNATAVQGGFLYVNTGVLDSDIAPLVLSHEIAHVLKRHQTRELQAQLIDTVETLEDLKDLLTKNTKKDRLKDLSRTISLEKRQNEFSRQQELQADACAIRIASQAGLNLKPLINRYIQALSGSDPKGDTNQGQSTTHPSYPDREKRMRAVLKQSQRNNVKE
ncbi:MAG: M48 family metallopeptidase [Gammaproteobacteria bacterium]|nr:M48 family metallopeptidase [Gammaproteobacteria bacterium]